MCSHVSVSNRNTGRFVQYRNKILNVGYVSSLPHLLDAVVCVFLWSTYASYWPDSCSPQQSQSPHRRRKEEGRESGKTDERQGKNRGEKGGMMVSDRVGENEGERKKGESLWGKKGVQ